MFFKACCIGHYSSEDKKCKVCKVVKDCRHISKFHSKDANLIMLKDYGDVKKMLRRFCNDRHTKQTM